MSTSAKAARDAGLCRCQQLSCCDVDEPPPLDVVKIRMQLHDTHTPTHTHTHTNTSCSHTHTHALKHTESQHTPTPMGTSKQGAATAVCGREGLSARSAPALGMARFILAQEGVRGLWAGLSASLLREGFYSSIRLGSYDFSRRWCQLGGRLLSSS
jgi:hypothetical protein